MPELPEVESVRRGLVRSRLRTVVTSCWRSELALREHAAWRDDPLSIHSLVGATPGALLRRGKYILWRFEREARRMDRSEADDHDSGLGLLLHLGMSGRCGVVPRGTPRTAHTHLVLGFADDREVRLVDPRRFGSVRVAPWATLLGSPPIDALGMEPLSRGFSGASLAAKHGTSQRWVRDALLDQRAVAGIGNIYAIESLFLAGIDPRTPACRLDGRDWDQVARCLVQVLKSSIQRGGTTLKDFRNVSGEVGRNQDDLRVYGRDGAPCPRCSATIRADRSSGRGLMWCPSCQPRRARRSGARGPSAHQSEVREGQRQIAPSTRSSTSTSTRSTTSTNASSRAARKLTSRSKGKTAR